MSWILLFVLPTAVNAIGQPHYECGEHGRFEYCIDGIPGCIVGCHCHPGYYFDTETKICEPNAKLVHEYRRLYNMAPTRVPEIILPSNLMELEPTPTTANGLEAQVADTLAKDNDDLGDWLYNQFFKTIENQVINNTDTASDKPTRRSGDLDVEKQQPRRAGKKSKKKKGKKKKSDLRRKLLRITEDDSLFDSSSGSDEESSSDSDSESSDTSDDDSSEYEEPGGRPHECNSSHGHRKILMFNKKPRPPLPSFIFLPQMDTPFFPPIGLPPPAVPMFPMAPIPPVPMYPFPVTTPCNLQTTTKAPDDKPSINNIESTTAITTTTTGTTKTPDPLREAIFRSGKHGQRKKMLRQLQEQLKSPNLPAIMQRIKNKMRKSSPFNDVDEFENPFMNDDLNQAPPHSMINEAPTEDVDFKYLAQLIHKMDNTSGHHKTNGAPNINSYMHRSPHMPGLPNLPLEPPNIASGPNMPHGLPRGPLNVPKHPTLMNPNMPIDLDQNKPSRRFGDFENPVESYPQENQGMSKARQGPSNNRRYLESPNDSYYVNLGQQIASLIRKMDTTNDQKDNTESQCSSPPPQTFFSENSYGPKSFWERSIRSLLTQYHPLGDENYARKIYEDNLFNLESKVKTVATTISPMSLRELENFVFLIQKTKSDFQTSTPGALEMRRNGRKDVVDNSFNVNLLPRPYERHSPEPNSFMEPLTELLVKKLRNDSAIVKHIVNANNFNRNSAKQEPRTANGETNIRGALLNNFKNMNLRPRLPNYGALEIPTRNVHRVPGIDIKKERPTIDLNSIRNVSMRRLNDRQMEDLQRMVGMKFNEMISARRQLPHVPWLSPQLATMLSHNRNYRLDGNIPLQLKLKPRLPFSRNPNIHYEEYNGPYKNSRILQLPLSAAASIRRLPVSSDTEPSYFRHEIHHYDVLNK